MSTTDAYLRTQGRKMTAKRALTFVHVLSTEYSLQTTTTGCQQSKDPSHHPTDNPLFLGFHERGKPLSSLFSGVDLLGPSSPCSPPPPPPQRTLSKADEVCRLLKGCTEKDRRGKVGVVSKKARQQWNGEVHSQTRPTTLASSVKSQVDLFSEQLGRPCRATDSSCQRTSN